MRANEIAAAAQADGERAANKNPVYERTLFRAEVDRGLELVPAGFAGPQMPDATLVHVLGPFRSQESIAALCAGSEVTGPGL